MTTTKKSLKNAVGTQQKKNIETDYQDDDEIIDINEVRRRKGITGEKKFFFIACLRSFYEDEEFRFSVKSLTGLASYIAGWRIFYVNTHHGYRLMKYSSILSEIQEKSQIAKKKRKNIISLSITAKNSKNNWSEKKQLIILPPFLKRRKERTIR